MNDNRNMLLENQEAEQGKSTEILSVTPRDVAIELPEIGTRAYQNSVRGRADLAADAPSAMVTAILAVWGAVPIVLEGAE